MIGDKNPKRRHKKSIKGRSLKFRFKQLPMIIYLDKHFAEQSRDLKFYNFSAYWKDNEIYKMLKKVVYIERLEVKWNYKYRTVRARIHLTKEMVEIFQKGGNIALTKNERIYFL